MLEVTLCASSLPFKKAGSFYFLSLEALSERSRLLCCRDRPQGGGLGGRYEREGALWTPRPTHHPMQPCERPQVKTAQLSTVTYRNV